MGTIAQGKMKRYIKRSSTTKAFSGGLFLDLGEI
jgi:hypothetical protein